MAKASVLPPTDKAAGPAQRTASAALHRPALDHRKVA